MDVEATEPLKRLFDRAAAVTVADGRTLITVDDLLVAVEALATAPYEPVPWRTVPFHSTLGWRIAAAAGAAVAEGTRLLDVHHVLTELGVDEATAAAADDRLVESVRSHPPSEVHIRASIFSASPVAEERALP